MVKLAANIGMLWPERPLLARIDAAAQAGFRAIEMHWPYDVPGTLVAERCRRHDLHIRGINTAPGNLQQGERGLGAIAGRERDFKMLLEQSIDYCATSGATAIHVMAGNVAVQERSAARRTFAANLRLAAEKTASRNIMLLLEPLNPRDNPGYFYSTLAAAAELIAELGCANLKLQFDVYHVAITEGDVLSKLSKHLPIIGNVQIAAVPTRAEPDEGEIAYGAILTALDRLGYAGWVGCEYKPRGDTDAGLKWIREFGIESD